MAGRCTLLLICTSLISCALAEQRVLHAENESGDGILRRFGAESTAHKALAVAQDYNLDVWHATESQVDIYFPPGGPSLPQELAQLPHNTTPISTLVPKAGRKLAEAWDISSLENTTYHEEYHPLSEVQSFIKQLAEANPDITQLVNIGQSAEGRELTGLTISRGSYSLPGEDDGRRRKRKATRKSPTTHDGEKLGFVIVGAQHAREWIATAASTYIAQSLLTFSNESYSLSYLLDHFDFHIIPMPNPDGYQYTWEADRYWYKNRQIIGPQTECVGLDMNRNWASFTGYKWRADASVKGRYQPRSNNKSNIPTNPCSHWYPGTRAFESPEVNSIANWISTLPNVVAFVDLRSYGQMLSAPYSYTCKRIPKDAEDQIEAALGASHAIKSVHGTNFQVGSLCSMLYPAYGNIVDWMYSREAIKYSYVAHLRDTGTYGFSLPEKWIRPTGEETGGMIQYIAKFIAKQAKRQF